MGEVLGALILASDHSSLKPTFSIKPIKVFAEGVESKDGYTYVDKAGKSVKLLENVDPLAFYDLFSHQLGSEKQSAVIGSFNEQKRMWSTPSNWTESSS